MSFILHSLLHLLLDVSFGGGSDSIVVLHERKQLIARVYYFWPLVISWVDFYIYFPEKVE